MSSKYNILVVDDEIKNIQLGINILKKNSSYNLIFATSAQQTYERVKEYTFDLILLDIIMHPVDGFEICQMLKKDAATQDIPIIFLTAKTDEESILKGFKLGGVDYITKPFNEKELEARVQTHIQLKTLQTKMQKENEKKDKILLQMSKMNAIGEMIEHLSYQWRHPLSIISASSSAIQIQMQLENINNDSMFNHTNHIIATCNKLSNVVDDFKDFFKPDSNKEFFQTKEVIDKTTRLLEGTLEFYNIKLYCEVDDISMHGYKCAVMYSLINLLSNALDELIKIDYDKRYIFIDVKKNKDNELQIRVKDSANGINEEIVSSIFHEYISTKNLYEGSGLGLYMTKEVVQKKLHGTIVFKNSTYEFNNITLKGAEFTLTLPIDDK
jgi:DNA-binding response OmpR family regulator